MPSFFLPLLACVLASIGGRDQRLVALLSARLGASNALLIACWVVSVLTSVLAALAGVTLAAMMPPAGKTMLIAFALLFAAGELAWPIRKRDPVEPTRSLFAITLVLAAHQIGDAARFLVFAFAAASGVPALVALGGAIGSGAALTLGWALGASLHQRLPLRLIRIAIAVLLMIAAIWTGLTARGIL